MPRDDTTPVDAEILTCRQVHALPDDWGSGELRRLLADLGIDAGDAAEADLAELALMALGDLEPNQAGAAVLGAVFGDAMAPGVRANLAADLGGERPWEQLSDLSRQAGVFTATVLLQRAFPRRFGKPDAVRAEVALTVPTQESAALLVAAPAAVVLRALAPGLGPNSLVVRLYGEGLGGGDFPEAAHILWRGALRPDSDDPRRVVADVCGAQAFLGSLGEVASWRTGVVLVPDA